jgi:hypothetical protein
MQEYDIIPYGNSEGISLDRNYHLVNVTEMFKASGAPEHKKPAEWYRQEQAQELLTVLSDHSLGSLIETREGRSGGTWYCEELALAYAMYLSPRLHLACLRFILGSQRQPQQPAPADHQAELEQRVAALEQVQRQRIAVLEQQLEQARHQPEPDTITITFSMAGRYRLAVMRDLGGVVTPKQLFTELKRRGQDVSYLKILTWLHQSAKRGVLRHRQRGQYEITHDDDTDTR